MGGFIYKDLYSSEVGKLIDYFNGQFYMDYSKGAYDIVVENGYPEEKVVMGMLMGQDFEKIQTDNNIVLGRLLARKLNVDIGDKISLMLPDTSSSFAGYFPKLKVFNISLSFTDMLTVSLSIFLIIKFCSNLLISDI